MLKLLTADTSIAPLDTVKGNSRLMLLGPTYVGPLTYLIFERPGGRAAGKKPRAFVCGVGATDILYKL